MKARPFLTRYEIHHQQSEGNRATYDPTTMLLLVNGLPAALDSSFTDTGATRVTKVQQETTDDN